jgi:hypothetical protein
VIVVALWLSAALLFFAVPVEAEVRYTAASLRDPFGGQTDLTPKAEDPSAADRRVQSLLIQGMVASPKNPRAIINGKIYRVGSEPVPGVKITRIDKNGVYVQTGQKEVLLNPKTQPAKG